MIGTVINGQYKILEMIGEGGMGAVYVALDQELERRVALKFLRAELADDATLIQRFRDELKVLASFNHPNITTLFTSVNWQGHPVMVMELVEGETLQKMVTQRGPIPAPVSVPLITQALAGVSAAHRKKIIHRDLKPANLMRNQDGVVKVMDFGIAKIQSSPGVTRTNTVVGTVLYMAPEQIMGSSADARTDIYAMGVTLYELLAGRVPFSGNSQYQIEHAHIGVAPEPPTVYYPHIPENVVSAVMRALAKDPDARFQTADEFALALGDGSAAPDVTVALPVAQPSVHHAPPPAPVTIAERPVSAFVKPETIKPEPVRVAPETVAIPQTRPPRTAPPRTAPPRTERPVAPPEQHPPTIPPPVKTGRPPLMFAGLALAVVLILAGAAVWIRSTSNHPAESNVAANSGTPASPGAGQPPVPHPSSTAPPAHPPADAEPPISFDPKPPVIHEAPKPPVTEHQPPAAPTTRVAGKWMGRYVRCDDNRSTTVAMILSEGAGGGISGNMSYKTPEGASGSCKLSGAFAEHGKQLTLKAFDCSGSTPDYLSGNHRSLLTYSEAQLSGMVEPQEPCMTVEFTKR